jgi:hypothetical protein
MTATTSFKQDQVVFLQSIIKFFFTWLSSGEVTIESRQRQQMPTCEGT